MKYKLFNDENEKMIEQKNTNIKELQTEIH